MMAADRLRERTLSVTTLAADEFHAPSLDDFFPPSVLIHAGPFELDRLMLIRLLMSVLVAAFFVIAMRSPRLVPRGMQNAAELALDFVRINIAEEILGKEQGKRFLPVITTIFFIVVASNLASIIPFLNISPNARIGMPLVLAALAYIVFNYVGIKKYGFFKYVKSSIVVPGVPLPLHFLLVPIEFISTFILRPFTLMVRLMANMLAATSCWCCSSARRTTSSSCPADSRRSSAFRRSSPVSHSRSSSCWSSSCRLTCSRC
ncbi:hypothetical protein GCM10020255_093220 [Rhodococcus baikonurensis]